MKKIIVSLAILSLFLISGCDDNKKMNEIKFATSADYPPFEYKERGELKGFDVDLAHMLAKEMGKEAMIIDMQFSSILPTLAHSQVDAAISTITITAERQQNFDFSQPYYFANIAVVFNISTPISNQGQLVGKKIACQLGTTMELWLKKHVPDAKVVSLDNNNLAIESLKAGHVDAVLIDGIQGATFSKNNPGLGFFLIAQSDEGYGIALAKASPLKGEIDQALASLQAKGEIKELVKKWLGGG